MLTQQQSTDFSGTNARKLRRPTLPVRVRPIRASDAEALQAGFEALSETSRYYRFHSGMRRLPEHLLRYLSEVDGVNHVALLAFELAEIEAGHGVGVGRFVRDPSAPTTAELAVTVLDRAHGRGVARRLLAELGHAARARGIQTFTMSVIAGNLRARRLLSSLGAVGQGSVGDVMTFHLSVTALARAA
jgi:RimJ/RimL family protein N-acetyltransferase